jgi:predicted permease
MHEWTQEIRKRLSGLNLPPAREAEIVEELAQHLEDRCRELLMGGATESDARRVALEELSNPSVDGLAWGLRRVEREVSQEPLVPGGGGRGNFLASLWQDLRYGSRTLAKNPGFSVVAAFTLALGIGANTAIFSLINVILLKALPVSDPDQLVALRWESPHSKTDSLPYPTFEQLRDSSHVFKGMFAFCNVGLATSMDGEAGLATGQLVSGSFFSVLGVRAVAGRTFASEEDRVPGGDPVAVISYAYWKRQFGLDPGAIGKQLTLNGVAFTVIGVAGPAFEGLSLGNTPDIWVPMMMQAQVMDGRSLLNDPKGWFFQVMARRKPGVSLEQAAASLNVAYQQIARQETGARITPQVEQELASQKVALQPASRGLSDLRDRFAQPLLVLMALVGLVLLVSCANVASLLLTRASARKREIAVRAALGAGRSRLIRQLLTESLLLAALGSLVGLLLARFGDDLLLTLPLMSGRPLAITVRPDGTVLLFTTCVALLAAVLFGSAPAWSAARTDLNEDLKASTRSVATGNRRPGWGLRRVVVIGEVAVSLLLLAGAGMLVHSLSNLRDVNPGFNQDKVLLVAIDPTLAGYRGDRLLSLYKDLADAISTLPGVQSVGLSAVPPMNRGQWRTGVFVQGHVPGPNEDTTILWNLTGPNSFRTLQIPLLQGRDFVPQDDSTAPRVAIINQGTARLYFGNETAIGKRLSFTSPQGGEIEIVGVVADTKYGSLREATLHMLYLPYLQPPSGSMEFDMTLEIRTKGSPESVAGAVRQAIRGVDKGVPILGVRSLAEQVNNSLAQERMVAELSSLFGLLALVLASVGLYGVMTYTVARRTGEIGVRMALGATRSQVLWMVVRESLELVAIGVVVGIPLIFVFMRLISNQLYGITRGDPLTTCAAMALQATVALVATYIPARRATKVDPMVALRYE